MEKVPRHVRDSLFGARTVGGAPSELGEIAETVGSALSRSYDTTVALIVRCGTEFPGAAGVYATLVGMLSVRAPDFGAAVVRRAHAQLERTLRDPDVPPVRAPTLSPTPVNLRTGLPLALAVRFIVELAVVGVVSISSTLRFIQESVTTLTQAIEDAPAESAARGHYLDAVWYALASALIWCGDAIKSAEAGAEAGGEEGEGGGVASALSRVITSLGTYTERRAEAIARATSAASGGASAAALLEWGPDEIQLTWATLRALQTSEWDSAGVLGVDLAVTQPWRTSLLERSDVVPEGSQGIAELRSAAISPPARGDSPTWPLLGRIVRPFSYGLSADGATWADPLLADPTSEADVGRMLAGGAAEKVFKRSPVSQRWVLRQQLQHVLEAFMPAYEQAIVEALALPVPSGVRLEPVAVELLVGLAASPELTEPWRAYYARVLFEMCQLPPAQYSFKIAGAMRAGYAAVWRCCCGVRDGGDAMIALPPPRALSLGEEARLARWLAFLLSNFEFGWKWNEWADDAGFEEGEGGGESGGGGGAMDTDQEEREGGGGGGAGGGAGPSGGGASFLRTLLYRCQDLAKRETLLAVLPRSLHAVLPPVPTPELPYLDESDDAAATIDGVDTEVLRRLHAGTSGKMRARGAGPAIASWLVAAIDAELSAPARGEAEALALRIVMDALLQIGSATIQHMVVMLDRNKDLLHLLKERCSVEAGSAGAADRAILDAAAGVWRSSGATRNVSIGSNASETLFRSPTTHTAARSHSLTSPHNHSPFSSLLSSLIVFSSQLVFRRLLVHKVVSGTACARWLLSNAAVARATGSTSRSVGGDGSVGNWLHDVYVWEAVETAVRSVASIDARALLLWDCVVRLAALAGESGSGAEELGACVDRVRELCVRFPAAWSAAMQLDCPIAAESMDGWAAALVAALRQPTL